MKSFGPRATLPLLAALGLAVALEPQRADAGAANKVYRPVVVKGETEIELRGGYLRKDDARTNAHVFDIGYGITPTWSSEVVFKSEKANDGSASVQGMEWENILQFTEPGQYFVDMGWFAEAAASLETGGGYAIETGPMFEKQVGRITSTLDLLTERTFSGDSQAETEISYRFQSQYRSGTPVEFGLQAFGQKVVDNVENTRDPTEHVIGPALFGGARLGERNKLKWDAAVLKGLTDTSEDWRFRWQLEFEFY